VVTALPAGWRLANIDAQTTLTIVTIANNNAVNNGRPEVQRHAHRPRNVLLANNLGMKIVTASSPLWAIT
jgi:hypothetical protein